MTFHEPNPDVQPTGEEAGEYIEATAEERKAMQNSETRERERSESVEPGGEDD